MTEHESSAQSGANSCRNFHSWEGSTSCLRCCGTEILTLWPPRGIHWLWKTIIRSYSRLSLHSSARVVKASHVSFEVMRSFAPSRDSCLVDAGNAAWSPLKTGRRRKQSMQLDDTHKSVEIAWENESRLRTTLKARVYFCYIMLSIMIYLLLQMPHAAKHQQQVAKYKLNTCLKKTLPQYINTGKKTDDLSFRWQVSQKLTVGHLGFLGHVLVPGSHLTNIFNLLTWIWRFKLCPNGIKRRVHPMHTEKWQQMQ